jgi:two-component system sensor histidine kinase BaeS
MAWDINFQGKQMLKSLWVKFLILLLSVSIISLSAALILRELIINDFEEYIEGKVEDRIYRIIAAVEGSYEQYSGWNENALKEITIWALLIGYETKISEMNTNKAVETLYPLMKKRIMAITGFLFVEKSIDKEKFMSYPMFIGGKEIGTLEILFINPEEEQGKEIIFMKRSNKFLILSLIALGGLSIVLSFIFSKKLTGPIKKLTVAAKDISEGRSKSRVSASGNDEISTLSRTFNMMADNLEIQESLRKKLTSNIAHELRTPLTSIQGELEGMIDGLIKIDKERLLSLHEETGRLKKIIEGIEELSKAEASALELKRQSIDLKSFLSNIKDRFERLFTDKGVKLDLECDDILAIYADPDKLSQIVINLLSNALRATAAGGVVRMKTGMDDREGFIEIMDTGSGIKKEDLPFVFERFFKSSDGGLGLGLTIAKELADAHGGRIEVRSEYGKGATFTLFIPNFTNSS